ncbi:MAG: sulfite exporter TauE/SafE family protein [Armatimonadetes bacterium]|nr:sulfite exporter TauE/SafE family protein [Armatimonadota bacterium]
MYVGTIPTLPMGVALALIGFCVGVAGSFFGVGGAFLVTPALNILGFPMTLAIGTDLAHVTGKSVIATMRHRKLGHIDWKAGALLLLGTFPGVKLGTTAVMALEHINATETVLRFTYIALLTIVGSLILREAMTARGECASRNGALLQRWLKVKPLVSLPKSGIKSVSVWGVVLLGLATGFLSAFLGVGGGFIRMPALLYLVGMPMRIAVGTDLLEVAFSGGYGAFLYAREGRVDLIAAVVMLLGASVGSQLGALATRYVESEKIRFYLAVMVLGSAAAVLAKQLGQVVVSAVVLWTLALSLAGLIIWKLVAGIRADKKAFVSAKSNEPEVI